MRVAHVIEAMHQGGAESLVVEHARHAGPGVRSTVIALNRGGPAFEAAAATGAEVVLLAKRGARLAGLSRLARELRERGIEVVNAHNPVGAFYGTLAARLAQVPVVVRTEHSIDYRGRARPLYRPVETVLTALTDRVIAVCEAARASHVRRSPWAASRFTTILNGIGEAERPARSREQVRASFELAPDTPVVLAVGSLTPQKSQDVLLRALARRIGPLPGATLLLAGEGRLRGDLEALRDGLGLGARVRFLGARNDVGELLAACDVFALSSSREGLSVTLLEAMRAGRPAVVTDVGGSREAVLDPGTGRVVPVGDDEALAGALAGLLADPALREACGRAGRERWEKRFTSERMVRETEDLYRAALAARGSASGGAGGRGAR